MFWLRNMKNNFSGTHSYLEASNLNKSSNRPHYCVIAFPQNNKSKDMTKIRNRYNQAPYLTQDTNGKVTTSQLDITNESQEVSPFPALKMAVNNYHSVCTVEQLVNITLPGV